MSEELIAREWEFEDKMEEFHAAERQISKACQQARERDFGAAEQEEEESSFGEDEIC